MLAVGDQIPPFEAPDTTGRSVRSTAHLGRPLVIFFYPKAGSWGCTREAVEFAGRYPDLTARGVAVLGVSIDPPEAQQAFSMRCQLPFPLLVDPAGTIARQFGVLGAFGFARRVTFLVGADGRILQVTDSVLPGAHVREVLRYLERLSAGPGPPSDP